MSQPPQSPDAPGTTDVDGGVDSLADEVTSDVERVEAQAGDEDSNQHQAERSDQRSDEHDEDYRAPVVVAPLPGASAEPPLSSTPARQAQPAETPRPRHSALSLAAMASVAVGGLNPTRLALPQSETPERHIIGVIDTQGRHWEVHEARNDAVGASL
ncbi:MAG: macrolide 2'-phosphotransferase, partial [Actinomyces oris]